MRTVPRKISILGLLLLYGCSNDSSPSSAPAQKPAETSGNATAGAVKESPQISLDPFALLEMDEDTSKLIPLKIGTPTVGSVRIELMDPPKHGIATVNASTMTVGYSPMPDFHGLDNFSVRVIDGTSASIARTVPIVVKPIDDAPKCLSQTFGAKSATRIASEIVCSDVDSTSISIRTSALPAKGTLQQVPAGSDPYFVYNLAAGQSLADQFQVIATANGKDSAPATIIIDPALMGEKPVVVSETKKCTEDTECFFQLKASNSIPGQVFAYAIAVPVDPKVKAEVNRTTGKVTITTEPNYVGRYSFTYTAQAGDEVSDPATITLDIDAVNDRPTISLGATAPKPNTGGSYDVVEDNLLTFDYVINDVEKAESDLVVSLVSSAWAKQGLVIWPGNKRFTYGPNKDYNGSDEFQVQVCEKDSNPAFCSVPLVMKMNVTAVNDKPYANPVTKTINEDSGQQCIDLTLSGGDVDAADQGKLTFKRWDASRTQSGSQYCFTPNPNVHGTIIEKYSVTDPQGETAESTISIVIDPVDDPTTFTLLNCAVTEETRMSCQVGANDVDGPLTYAFTSSLPADWNFVTTDFGSKGLFQVTPPLNFVGALKLNVKTSGAGKEETREFTINVTNVYDKPIWITSAPADIKVFSFADINVKYQAKSPDNLPIKYEFSADANCGTNVSATQTTDTNGVVNFRFTCPAPGATLTITKINYTIKALDGTAAGTIAQTGTVSR